MSDELYRNAISKYREHEVARWSAANEATFLWEIETGRHLGLLYSVSIAGVVALLATGDYGLRLLPALCSFMTAFALLVFATHLATSGYAKLAKSHVERVTMIDDQVKNSVSDVALVNVVNISSRASTAADGTFFAARCMAWSSPILFIIGAISLIVVLLPSETITQ